MKELSREGLAGGGPHPPTPPTPHLPIRFGRGSEGRNPPDQVSEHSFLHFMHCAGLCPRACPTNLIYLEGSFLFFFFARTGIRWLHAESCWGVGYRTQFQSTTIVAN